MTAFDSILWIAIAILLLLPPSLDPAIRIKMRQMLRGDHPESRGAEWIIWYDRDGKPRQYFAVDRDGRFWTTKRSIAARFNTADVAIQTIANFERDSVKVRSGVEIA